MSALITQAKKSGFESCEQLAVVLHAEFVL